jgi:predicted GTPase
VAATAVRRRVVIMGAAGRDFHDFNMLYRDDPTVEVVAFTATQIPGIENRRYPPGLAGPLYPEGIPIRAESELDALLRDGGIDTFVFAYSDIGQDYVMHAASRVLAAGADFLLPGPARTMLRAKRPVIAVSAVRTGCGKSQTARWLSRRLKGRGLRVAAIRHPMPYGDLARQAVQRFETPEDLAAADCTIEEREEYEPHIAAGPNATSCSGTAATTTCPSCGRTCISSWPTRAGPATKPPIIPARRCCAWPISW